MPAAPPDVLALADEGLVTRAQLLAAGMTRGAVSYAARGWRAVVPGIYVVDDRPVDLQLRCRCALLRYPGAVVCGVTAAAMAGLPVLDQLPRWSGPGAAAWQPFDDVHLSSERRGRGCRGVRLHWVEVNAGDRTRLGRVPVTTIDRTLIDTLAAVPLCVAVVLTDAACARDQGLAARLRSSVLRDPGLPNRRLVLRVLDLSDPRAESVLESLLRVLLVLAGLPVPASQVALRDAGGVRVDFLYSWERLVIEADGRATHEPWEAGRRDRIRQNAIVNAGYRILRFTWREVTLAPVQVVETVRDALRLSA